MAKLNRTCGICRKKYSYCPSCAADAKKPTWMAIFCSENCRELYNVLNDYDNKHLSEEEAFILLNNLDLSCSKELPGYYKPIFDRIFNSVKEKEEQELKNKELRLEDVIENTESINNSENASDQKEIIKKNTTEVEVVKNKVEKEISAEIINEFKEIESVEIIEEIDVIKRPKTKKKVKDVE